MTPRTRLTVLVQLISLSLTNVFAKQGPLSLKTSDPLNGTSLNDSKASTPGDLNDMMGVTTIDGLFRRSSWDGLTTFARSQPLRCLGVDQGANYDVAILGTRINR